MSEAAPSIFFLRQAFPLKKLSRPTIPPVPEKTRQTFFLECSASIKRQRFDCFHGFVMKTHYMVHLEHSCRPMVFKIYHQACIIALTILFAAQGLEGSKYLDRNVFVIDRSVTKDVWVDHRPSIIILSWSMSLDWHAEQPIQHPLRHTALHWALYSASRYGVFLSPKLQKGVSAQRQTSHRGCRF